jgi:DNA invertase Pin-like site-specific DNA recombinase
LLGLQKAGVDFVVVNMPNANRLTVSIMAMVAEEELRMIRERARDALAAAKLRGVKLGGRRRSLARSDIANFIPREVVDAPSMLA